MKKKCAILLAMLVAGTTIMSATPVKAAESEIIKNDETGMPDKVLYDAILSWVDGSTGDAVDGVLTQAEANELTFFFQMDEEKETITSLRGLEYCKNLEVLDLAGNAIRDISPVAELTKLKELNLCENQISDISAVSSLTNLTGLFLSNNEISDISALAKLTKLQGLDLMYNQISDISVLSDLTNLGLSNDESDGCLYVNNNNISKLPDLKKLTNLSPESWGGPVFEDTMKVRFYDNQITLADAQKNLPAQLLASEQWVNAQHFIADETDNVEEVKEELKNELSEAEKLDGVDYTKDTWEKYVLAIDNAKAVLANSDATEEDVISALETLKVAKQALEKVDNEENNKPGSGDEENNVSGEDNGNKDDSGEKGNNSQIDKKEEAPKTGDVANVGMLVSVMMVVVCTWVLLLKKKYLNK